jgi:hypothetical protein
MYSFVHSKTRNRLEVEKAEALVYIYTNSRLLRQRAGADPIHYYDDNIFSEDSDDDAGAPSESDGDDNDGHSDSDGHDGNDGHHGNDGHDSNDGGAGQGLDGSDGDTSNGGDQPLRQVPLVNPMNAENERVWDWNDIDAEGENGVHELAAVESIVNVQSNEETAVPSAEHLYERADEELDDDANTEVSF